MSSGNAAEADDVVSIDNPIDDESDEAVTPSPQQSRVTISAKEKQIRRQLSRLHPYQLNNLCMKRHLDVQDGSKMEMVKALCDYKIEKEFREDVPGEMAEVRPDLLTHHENHAEALWTPKQQKMAGRRVSPKFHDKLREISRAPPQGNHIVLYLQFYFVSVIAIIICFAVPVDDACTGHIMAGEDIQFSFYLFALPGVTMMFATVPSFAFLLVANLPSNEELEEKLNVTESEKRRLKRIHRNLKKNEEQSFTNPKRLWRRLKPAAVLAVPATVMCLMFSFALSYLKFGFPLPFTPIFAGFPIYFLLFPAVVVYLKCFDVDINADGIQRTYTHGVFKELLKVLVLMVLTFALTLVYPALYIGVQRHPDFELLFSLAFPATAFVTKRTLSRLFHEEFLASPNLAGPLLAYHDVISAIFPQALLPSTVSFMTFFGVAILNIVLLLSSLAHLWWPVLTTWLGHKRAIDVVLVEKFEKEVDQADKLEDEKDLVEQELEEAVQKVEEAANDNADGMSRGAAARETVAAIRQDFVSAGKAIEAQMALFKAEDHRDDDSLQKQAKLKYESLQTANMPGLELRAGEMEAELDVIEAAIDASEVEKKATREWSDVERVRQELEEKARHVLVESSLRSLKARARHAGYSETEIHDMLHGLADEDDRKAALAAKLLEKHRMSDEANDAASWSVLFGHEHIMETEFRIVILVVTEFFELLVPALILALEIFLRFGWNQHAIPAISNQSSSLFMESALAKVAYIVLQLCSCVLMRAIINNCSELRALRVLSWTVRQNFEILTIATVGALVFCYTALIPHYNFSIDFLVDRDLVDMVDDILNNDDAPIRTHGCALRQAVNGSGV